MSRKINAKELNYRPSRPRRRRPPSNVPNLQGEEEEEEASCEASISAKKMRASSTDIIVNLSFCYRIIEFVSVFAAISDITVCRKCKHDLSFGQSGDRGLGFKISVKCKCGTLLINSGPFVHNGFDINKRVVLAMRLLGVARAGLNIFCGIMDLGRGLSQRSYDGIVQYIYVSSKKFFEISCKKAIQEEIENNEKEERPVLNLSVSGDGSWKKRGFSSLFGVTTLIAYHTGKVIDLIVKNSYCQTCLYFKNNSNDVKYETHKENCHINHKGSSGKMEVDAMLEMFQRSQELYGVKYSNYIGDGDAKTFKAILDVKPYGDNFTVVKSECVGHVEKRMGSRLRNLKKTDKLGGKGKLTDVLIKKLTKYYGLAIRRNPNSKDDMKRAIMATYYHMISTNEQPQHQYCPPGADSWCAYRVAEASNETLSYNHPPPLHQDVQKKILPIYKDLSRDDLLTRCLGGYTQNANESFNATVWRLAPKHLHCGWKIIEIAAFLAAGMFNDGYNFILNIMNDLELPIGIQCKTFADEQTANRIRRQDRRSQSRSKEARIAKKKEAAAKMDAFEEKEDILYGPGIAD